VADYMYNLSLFHQRADDEALTRLQDMYNS